MTLPLYTYLLSMCKIVGPISTAKVNKEFSLGLFTYICDRRLAGVFRSSVAIAFPHICFQDSVRDLGVILDQELSFSMHINQLTRSCYYQFRQLWIVSRSLSCSAEAALVHAFVTSRLDHCSSILAGLPLAQTARRDRVLRCAARLIGRIPKYGSVSAYMRDTLHWLPIAQRIC